MRVNQYIANKLITNGYFKLIFLRKSGYGAYGYFCYESASELGASTVSIPDWLLKLSNMCVEVIKGLNAVSSYSESIVGRFMVLSVNLYDMMYSVKGVIYL